MSWLERTAIEGIWSAVSLQDWCAVMSMLLPELESLPRM